MYKSSLSEEVRSVLHKKRFETPKIDVTFQHTYKNGKYHIVEPVSFDYKRQDSIQERAVNLLGTGTALKDNPEIGKIYLLIGKPQTEGHMPSYNRAKDLLNSIPLATEIIEEDGAVDFANSFDAKVKEDLKTVAA